VDILSDMTAGLIGGMGMGALGRHRRPLRGVSSRATAPRPTIMGQGKANPTGMILSAAMMLDWLADKHGLESAAEAGEDHRNAPSTKAYAGGIKADGVRR